MKAKPLMLAAIFCLAFMFALPQARAQTKTITGKITNDKGVLLPGASVKIKGTKTGVSADGNGNFTISVPSPKAVLVISYAGYADQETSAGAPQFSIRLVQQQQSLNEVVVIGYGTARKKELTGAIAIVNEKDFQQGSITTPEQLIAGKVAGVSITSNGGSPGAGSTIRIRGGASLKASNDPLIVIDGVPLSGNGISGASNTLSLINPNDIATFTILKDAAATAIYGSRASNGVLLITTKKGVAGKPVINFSTQVSIAKLVKEADVLTAAQFRSYVDSLGTGLVGGLPFKALLGTANTDWQKEIYKTAISTDNNLSISGAYKKMPYRVSVGYLNQDGILRTDNLNRISAGISLSPSLMDDHLKININIRGAETHARFANGAAVSAAVYYDPTKPVRDNSPFGGYSEWYNTDAQGGITLNKLAPRNPVGLLNLYNNSSTVQRSFGNIQLDYKFHFLPDLHANVNLGYDVAKGLGVTNVPAYAAQNFLDTGQLNRYKNEIKNAVVEYYLNYNKDLKDIHSNINATVGYGHYDNFTYNYGYPTLRANGDTIQRSVYPRDPQQNTIISYYGRLIYTYNSKYIVAASIRRDGSSKFSNAGQRWGTFPSVAVTWRINQEQFLAASKTLSDLKLRLSYGITGNQDGINNYPYQSVYAQSDNASLVQFGNTYYHMSSPPPYDAGIKWEQSATFNAGIDYGFLNNRITGSIDVYSKKTKDLINEIPIPAGSNFGSILLTNIGNVENKGVEFQINAIPVRTKNFSWDVSFNATYNSSKITKLTASQDPSFVGSPFGANQINSIGYAPNTFYVYHQQYNNSGKPIEGVYADINGDGAVTQSDLYRYKSPTPKFVLGFSTQVTMDKWSVSTVLRANIGNYMYNSVATGAQQANVFNALGYLANTMSELTKSHFYYGQPQSDYFIQNASFLKMDNLQVAYNAGKVFNKVALRLSANCQNVFTITKYTGIDPEIFSGVDNSLYPRPRTYVIGANFQF